MLKQQQQQLSWDAPGSSIGWACFGFALCGLHTCSSAARRCACLDTLVILLITPLFLRHPAACVCVCSMCAAAGLRIDAEQFSRSRMGYYTGEGTGVQPFVKTLAVPAHVSGHSTPTTEPPKLFVPAASKLVSVCPAAHVLFLRFHATNNTGMCLVSADTLVPAAPEDTIPITGYPEGSWINYASWSPDGTYITFTTRSPGEWVGGWIVAGQEECVFVVLCRRTEEAGMCQQELTYIVHE